MWPACRSASSGIEVLTPLTPGSMADDDRDCAPRFGCCSDSSMVVPRNRWASTKADLACSTKTEETMISSLQCRAAAFLVLGKHALRCARLAPLRRLSHKGTGN